MKKRRKRIVRALKFATKGMIGELKLIGKDELLSEISDDKGNTLLHRACEGGDLATVQFLIRECQCNVNASNLEFKQPLHVACIKGSVKVVRELLDSGSNINSLKRNRWTALMHASSHGHTEIVELLIERGARVDEKNRENATALYVAARSGRIECVRALLNHGANINTKQRNLRTPLHVSIMNGHYKVLDLMLKSGAKQDVVDKAGMTLLHEAAYAGNVACAKMLKISLYSRDMLFDEWGRHPIHAASMRGHIDFVTYVLDLFEKRGKEEEENIVNIPDTLMGGTALFYACSEGHANVARLLLSKGASCDVQTNDKHKRTCFHAAASWGRLSCVRVLLEHGARPDVKDSHGVSALDMAKDCGHEEVVRLIMNSYNNL